MIEREMVKKQMRNQGLSELRNNLSVESLGKIVFLNFANENTRQYLKESIITKTIDRAELRHALENTFNYQEEGYTDGIGGCPKYDNLSYDELVEDYNTTLVIDLVNFTARSLHSKDDVEKLKDLAVLKKKFINSCVLAVGLFGGHVHDITGDGIIAFFNYGEKHEQINDAMLTAIFMIYSVQQILNPLLKAEDENHRDIQVRVGVDTGNVIWTKMGNIKNLDSCEVKAVGFSVDSAAKLSNGKSWELKIGEYLYDQGNEEFKELTSKYDDYKRTIDGVEIIYKGYYFNWEKYISIYNNNIDEVLRSQLPLLGYEKMISSQVALTSRNFEKLSKPNNSEKVFG